MLHTFWVHHHLVLSLNNIETPGRIYDVGHRPLSVSYHLQVGSVITRLQLVRSYNIHGCHKIIEKEPNETRFIRSVKAFLLCFTACSLPLVLYHN
jgi:hypothetical protein